MLIKHNSGESRMRPKIRSARWKMVESRKAQRLRIRGSQILITEEAQVLVRRRSSKSKVEIWIKRSKLIEQCLLQTIEHLEVLMLSERTLQIGEANFTPMINKMIRNRMNLNKHVEAKELKVKIRESSSAGNSSNPSIRDKLQR